MRLRLRHQLSCDFKIKQPMSPFPSQWEHNTWGRGEDLATEAG